MSDEKKNEKSEQPLKFRKIGDTSSKPAGGLAVSLGKQEGMKMDKRKKRDDKITDLNLPKQPEDTVTLGSGRDCRQNASCWHTDNSGE